MSKLKFDCTFGGCDGGTHYVFTIYSREHSGDGLFSLGMFAGDGNVTATHGKVYTLRGENDATVWQCISEDGQGTFHFLTDPDSGRIFIGHGDSGFRKDRPLYLMQESPESPAGVYQ